MRVYFPILFSMVAIAVLGGVEILLLKTLHRDWWRSRKIRMLSYAVPLAGIAGLTIWALGVALEYDPFAILGGGLTTVVLVVGIALMLSLPLSAVFHVIDRVITRFARKRNQTRKDDIVPDLRRRKLLTTGAAAFPLIAVAAGGKGLASAYADPRLPVIPLYYPQLPPGLEGLRILHLSDVHVGPVIGMDDLERMVELSTAMNPDIVLLTGDFSDDAPHYHEALRLAAQIPARYGSYASIGNHEYFRGIQAIRRAYDRGPIPLLLDAGQVIDIDGTPLYLAGADDPRSMRNMPDDFFRRTADRALRDKPDDAFSILLSHRPQAFDTAARLGVELTLSGHTHGGQIGFGGRSLLYAVNPEKYMWGLYRQNGSKLYVSAGAGHWFPYRIGCPAEIPLYVLTATPVQGQE
jgi:uncharacterized protein